MPAKVLKNVAIVPCWTTFVGAMAGLFKTAGTGCPLFEVAGRTGFAFRMNVREDVDASGPATYPNAEVTRRAFDQMGWDFDQFTASPADNVFRLRRSRAISAVEAALEKDLPSIVWGAFLSEYALVIGYDSDERAFRVSTVLGAEADAGGLPYDRLGEGAGGFLNVIVPREKVALDESRAALAALKLAVGHTLGAEPHYAGFANGLAGYALWIDALRTGRAELFGTAYNVQVYGEARRFAAQYLSGLAAADVFAAGDALAGAADDYRRVADNFSSLAEMVQFRPDLPRKDKVNTEAAGEAVELLERALFWERQAVEKVEAIIKTAGGRSTPAGANL